MLLTFENHNLNIDDTKFWYHAIDSGKIAFYFDKLYQEIVFNIPENGIFIEIGCYKGCSLSYFAELSKLLNKKINIYGIDPFLKRNEEGWIQKENIIDEFRNNLRDAGVFNQVNYLRDNFLTGIDFFEDNSVECIFLNLDGRYNEIENCLEKWYPKLINFGYMTLNCFSGYCNIHENIKSFCKKQGIKKYLIYQNKDIHDKRYHYAIIRKIELNNINLLHSFQEICI